MSKQMSLLERIEASGFAILSGVFTQTEVERLISEIEDAVKHPGNSGGLSDRSGSVFGARNLIQNCTTVREVWRKQSLTELLKSVLGPEFGLVRALYFDKPPGRSWSLAWHRDKTIAVRAHLQSSGVFSKPTTKAGTPHVEATDELLQTMLTLRVHLDDVSDNNGPLHVLPGSHFTDEQTDPVTIYARRGDVLAMRPLVSHCSTESHPDSTAHRRILHLEFSGQEQLPGGYEWHDFIAN